MAPDEIVVGQHEVRGRVVAMGLTEGLELSQLLRVAVHRPIEAAHRRPVHAGSHGEHGVERGRSLGVPAEREEREGPHLVNHRIRRREGHGLVTCGESLRVLALLERLECGVEDRVGRACFRGRLGDGRSTLHGARIGQVAVVGDVVVHHDRLRVVVRRGGHHGGGHGGVVGVDVAAATVSPAP